MMAVQKSFKSAGFRDRDKPLEVRETNIEAAKAVADAVRTSLGPRGMDKMITASDGSVTITNDGATILKLMSVLHPAAKMLVELSHAQDVEAGDGTTSVVVIAGSLLNAAQRLLRLGIHPSQISESFQAAASEAVQALRDVSIKVDLNNRDLLLKCASTSLNSKVISQHSDLFAPMAVDAVLRVKNADNVDLRDIRVIRHFGGTVDNSELVDGLMLNQGVRKHGNIPTRVENAKIGLIQFQLSAPKTDLDNQVLISDYTAMDRVFREERQYILNLCKQIKKAGCNVLLIQKSILRDAVNDLSLHILSKMKIMVITDIERDEIEFVCKTLGCKPVAHVNDFTAEKLGSADIVEDTNNGTMTRMSGVSSPDKTASIVIHASNKMTLDEAERSFHDALCVIRCLVKERALIAGGGAVEIEMSNRLRDKALEMTGVHAHCFNEFADALEIVPLTLAENAGLSPISVVTELRNRHHKGDKYAGINVKKGVICNSEEENVLQPLLVTTSAISLAAETVASIMKIDDVLFTR